MRVAIVGAGGFIGSRLIEMFHLGGLAEVRPVVRSFAGLARLSRFDLDCRVADARDRDALCHALDGCDVVVHAATGDPEVIVESVAPVYEAAQKSGVKRIIYLSSASVHGQAPAAGTDERSPVSTVQPLPYNAAKVKAERRLSRLRQAGSVETVVLRPAIVFGPRSRWTGGLADMLLDGSACLVNDGSGICNSVYVDNLIEAVRLSLETPQADRQTFLIADTETVTWLDLYSSLATALGIAPSAIPRVDCDLTADDAVVHRADLAGRDLVEKIRSTPAARALLPALPSRLKKSVRAALETWQSAPPPSEWSVPNGEPAGLSLEMRLLQSCSYKLPIDHARDLLGYAPPVSFEEGCRRSAGWLAFAGYPVGTGSVEEA